jgi:RNA polymerase sigma factor (sigma-70 family)
MIENTARTAQFERMRPQLRALAYRLLSSVSDAEDAVQETWLRLHRADGVDIGNPEAWLTTVLSRVCLNMLRGRRFRRSEELVAQVPDPIVDTDGDVSPEHQALLADAVGLALYVVLDTLPPAERLAFVLHDVFEVPFGEIAAIVDKSPEATRKLASRARRRIQDANPVPDGNLAAQREVVDAFFAAGRQGDLDRLVSVLHPDVVLRGDFGLGVRTTRGATAVARLAASYGGPDREVRPAAINGAAGAVIVVAGRPVSIMGFLVVGRRIAAIDVLADPDRLARIDLSAVT